MVVDQILVHEFTPFETERETPIARYSDAPHALTVAAKRMQAVSRPVDVAGTTSHFQHRQRPAEPRHQIDGKATGIIVLRESTQALVSYPQCRRLTRDGVRILHPGDTDSNDTWRPSAPAFSGFITQTNEGKVRTPANKRRRAHLDPFR